MARQLLNMSSSLNNSSVVSIQHRQRQLVCIFISAAQKDQCVKMPRGRGHEQLVEETNCFPHGEVGQGASKQRCPSKQGAEMATKAGDAPGAGCTAATQRCRDQNSEPPLSFPAGREISAQHSCPSQLQRGINNC